MLNQIIITINLKYQHPRGMIRLTWFDGSYSISALQNYFEYIIKKHETIDDVSPVLIYVNEINNRIVFKIKSGYKLELLSKETIRLLGSSADTIDSDKNSELVPKLESVDLVLESVDHLLKFGLRSR